MIQQFHSWAYIQTKWKWKSFSHFWLFVTPWTIQSMEFSRSEYWSGEPFPSPRDLDLPNPGIKPRSPALRVDSLPAEPQRKPKNTGVGSPSLLQWIFPTQESNQSLLNWRWILYQLRYEGSLTVVQKDICTLMFIAALFTIAKTWKQLKCSSMDEWIKKMWYIYTTGHCSAIKK